MKRLYLYRSRHFGKYINFFLWNTLRWWRQKVMRQISEEEGKPLMSSSKICPEACCTVAIKGRGGRSIHSASFTITLFLRWSVDIFSLKVHKHEIILNFFLTKIKFLYSLGKFSKKNSLLILRFSPEFRSSNIFAVTEHAPNQIFLERFPKIFFLQNVHLGPFRWVPKRFFKIWILYSRNLHFNVGFLNNFRNL